MVLNTTTARAMGTQLERVNHNPERLQERIDELETQLRLLREVLGKRDNQIVALKRLAGQSADGAPERAPATYNGRPVITPTEAAQRAWVSRSTVNRYLTSGHWQGVQMTGSNRWLVFADQTLDHKHGRKKQ